MLETLMCIYKETFLIFITAVCNLDKINFTYNGFLL